MKHPAEPLLFFVAVFLLLLPVVVRADTLVVTKQHPWHTKDQVFQVVAAEEVRDEIGYWVVNYGGGKQVQIKKSLIITSYDLPKVVGPEDLKDSIEYEKCKQIGEQLNKIAAANPKVREAVNPYILRFNQVIVPELERYNLGDRKENGVWYTRAQYEAKLIAEEKALREANLASQRAYEEEQKALKEREMEIQREWEAKQERLAQEAREAERLKREEEERSAKILADQVQQQEEEQKKKTYMYIGFLILTWFSIVVVTAIIVRDMNGRPESEQITHRSGAIILRPTGLIKTAYSCLIFNIWFFGFLVSIPLLAIVASPISAFVGLIGFILMIVLFCQNHPDARRAGVRILLWQIGLGVAIAVWVFYTFLGSRDYTT